jgi:DNA integrity scanning protein DisA with diadenylate cyclase activity
LNNKFLVAFAELVTAKESGSSDSAQVMLQLDILIALMEKVKLKKENYVALMRGVKTFVDDRNTQKKGYRILTKIVERFDLESFD